MSYPFDPFGHYPPENPDKKNDYIDTTSTPADKQPDASVQPETTQSYTYYGDIRPTQQLEPQNYYTPPTGYPPFEPKQKKKEPKKINFGVLIACCLLCAMLGGGVASGAFLYANSLTAQTTTDESSNTATPGTSKVVKVDYSGDELISAIAEKASPSVVGIRVTASVQSGFFFGGSQTESGEGSGIIYTADGYIITNYHVISLAVEAANQNAASISVYLPDDPDTAIPASVVGYDSESDLAVIKIEKTGLTAIEIGNSDELKVGQTAVAIGNPGGLEYMGSVSSGIISGLNRTVKLESTAEIELIQTDAAINPGNSGGALVNAKGQLIGVNSVKIAATEYEGMGFAIPVNYVVNVCDNIINNKDVKKAYVGVTISSEYTSDILKRMGYPAGAVVESVAEGSPADEIHLQQGDIITAFDGVSVTSASEYNTERLKHKPGETVTLTVYRSGRSYKVDLTLGESLS